mmetsp:Transcript_4648/g.5977  ORF Transcript_4648/g.5977 Transcript_4648/m.5977 type:complete len:708 (+) Transcript_4648:81-2204(+)
MLCHQLRLLYGLISLILITEHTFAANYVDTGDENYWTTAVNANKGYITSSSLTFIPAEVCTPTEIVLKFKADFNITTGDKIAVGLSGFTTGLCDNIEGESITAVLDEVEFLNNIDPGTLKMYPDSKFLGGYREGLVSSGFQDSKLFFTVREDVLFPNGTEIVINIDQGNMIKPNCAIDANGNGNFTISVQANSLGKWVDSTGARTSSTAVTSSVINQSTAIPGGCPVSDVKLFVDPPRPKMNADITISFRPGFHLNPNDNITVTLGGFTSGDAISEAGRDIAMGDLNISTVVSRYNTDTLEYVVKSPNVFNASWIEGEAEVNRPGFNTSRVRLTVNKGFYFLPGVQFDVQIFRTNHIKANCGTPGDYQGIKIKAHIRPDADFPRASKHLYEVSFPSTPRGGIQPIGDGCRSFLNFCNGHGVCDYCLNKCICNKGYGAQEDTFDVRAKPGDCAGRVCPLGPSFTNFQPRVRLNATGLPLNMDGAGQSASESAIGDEGQVEAATSGRTLAECSGVGRCNYDQGACECPPGWSGSACERRACPGGESNPCSGHGQCLNMKQMALASAALPLSNGKGFGPPGHYAQAGSVEQSPGTWDAHSLHGCLCDSSWEVGLGSNQTQEPEYFGANCGFRHCPSGDDPVTIDVNELNCTNVTARGGKGVGSPGNRCHVDCSNRGICDFRSGICNCFEGFIGANCGTPKSALLLERLHN